MTTMLRHKVFARWKQASKQGDIPSTPGVYAWFYEGHLCYIGRATNLRARYWHHRSGGIFDASKVRGACTLKYRESRYRHEELMLEARLIERLQPPLNRHGKDSLPIRRGYSYRSITTRPDFYWRYIVVECDKHWVKTRCVESPHDITSMVGKRECWSRDLFEGVVWGRAWKP